MSVEQAIRNVASHYNLKKTCRLIGTEGKGNADGSLPEWHGQPHRAGLALQHQLKAPL